MKHVLNVIDYHPFFVYLVFLLAMAPSIFFARQSERAQSLATRLPATPFYYTICSYYFFVLVIYISTNIYFDPYEIPMTVVSSLLLRGQPLYHSFDSAERYTQMAYGPITFLINGVFLNLLGPSVFSSKLGGALAGLSACVVQYVGFRRIAGPKGAAAGVGFLVLSLLFFYNFSFWPKSDSFIILCASAALTSTLLWRRDAAAIACGVALGLATDMKVHSVLYIVPVLFIDFESRAFLRKNLIASLTAATLATVPFLDHRIDFRQMVDYLLVCTRHGLVPSMAILNIEFLLYFLIPEVVVMGWLWACGKGRLTASLQKRAPFLSSLAACILLTLVAASKPGAGPHHFMPYLPLISYVLVTLWGEAQDNPMPIVRRRMVPVLRLIGFSFLLSLMGIALVKSANLLRICVLNHSYAKDVDDDIRSVVRANPNHRISMGYGEDRDFRLTYHCTTLVFLGHPILIEAGALMDMEASGIGIPQTTVNAIEEGRVSLWLIPRGNTPFAMHNLFYTKSPIFSEDFRVAFLNHYSLLSRSKFFDLWFYDGTGPGPQHSANR